MTRLHIDDFKEAKYPVGREVEGLTTYLCKVQADKLFSVLDKICPAFLVVGYLFYFIEEYEPFRWPPYGNFMLFNFVHESKNFVPCRNATDLSGWETPSLLRMAVLKAFPSVFLRAAVLPLLFGRLLFLTMSLSKWRRHRSDKKYDFVEPLTMAAATIELISGAVFTATTSHHDSLYHHKTAGVTFVVLAVVSFTLVTFLSLETGKSIQYPLMFYAGIFSISTPISLYSYFGYAANKTCTPLVDPQFTLLEVMSMASYTLFYWKANLLVKNVSLVVFSTKQEVDDVDSRKQSNEETISNQKSENKS